MPSIDERIVEMKFKDDQFKRGISGTLKSLTDLKSKLNLKGAGKGLEEIDKAGKNIKLDHIANGVQGLQNKFSAMSVVAITALANIASRAVDTGIQLVKSLTIDPITTGLEEYETQLNSVQTILANTAHEGTNIKDVNGALSELNTYADKTIYNFTEMARNIGTFTAAGVKLDTSTEAIKGIANLAAVSGSNSQQASTAMYQLSQALSTGRVSLMDWNSVVNAGMGGKVFQDALIETAKVQGVAVDSMIKKEGSFRDSLTKHGWLTADILTETLAKFTGDLSEAELKQKGYNDKQIKSILELGRTANDAATKVKTMSQLLDTLKEAAQSGWTESWQYIFGDFEEAKELFTGVSQTFDKIIGDSADARNKVLKDWKDLGGRDLMIQAIADAFKGLLSVINPIKDAFREIFPALNGQDLYNFSKALADLAKNLTLSDEAANNLKRTFRGVFAVVDIGWMVIKGLAGVILDLLGVVFQGSGGFLEFTGNIGDWLVSVRDAIKNGEGLTKFFDGLSAALRKPIEWLKALGRAIADIFSGNNSGGEGLAEQFNPLTAIGKGLMGLFEGLWGLLKGVAKFIGPFAEKVGTFLGEMFTNFGDMLSNLDFDHILSLINTGLFAGLVILFKNFLKGGWLEQIKGLFSSGEGGGIVDSIKEIFGGLTDTLSAMQANLKAGTLIKIAGAIALLTASVVALSLIDVGGLAKALSAISIMFLQLGVALLIFSKFATGPAFIKLPFIAGSLILLSAAVLVLSAAVKNLSDLDWDELAKGLVGVGGLLASLNLFMAFAKTQKRAVATGVGLILLGTAINILASAVGKFAKLNWGEIARGLTTLAGVFTLLGVFSHVLGKNGGIVLASTGILIMSGALLVLTKVLKEMAKMQWDEIGRSMVVLAGSLTILAGAMYIMSGGIPGAMALLVVAGALRVLTPALKEMGGFSWEEIGKGLVLLAGSLVVLAGGMYLMTGAIPGAIALIFIAGALRVLTPALKAMSQFSWGEIGKSLVMLAGALTVLGISGILILPAIPGLMLLGVAIGLIGVGTLAAGAGLMLFSAGLVALAAAGGGAIAVLIAAVKGLLGLIPYAMEQLGLGFVAFIEAIAANQVAIIEAVVSIGTAILLAIQQLTPQIVATLVTLVWTMVSTLETNVPRFVTAGANIIIGFLNGIANKMPGIITAGVNVIVAFIQGIRDNQGRVIDEAASTVIAFVNSVASTIRARSGEMREAGANLGMAIADGMTGGLASKAQSVANKAAAVGASAIAAIKKAIDSHSPSKKSRKLGRFVSDGFAFGIGDNADKVAEAGSSAGNTALDSMKSAMSGIAGVIDSDIDVAPTITPVLDLSSVKRDAGLISGMMSDQKIDASTSRSRAQVVARQMVPLDEGSSAHSASESSIKFVQYNYSPKALNTSEIYRQTNNQISRADRKG